MVSGEMVSGGWSVRLGFGVPRYGGGVGAVSLRAPMGTAELEPYSHTPTALTHHLTTHHLTPLTPSHRPGSDLGCRQPNSLADAAMADQQRNVFGEPIGVCSVKPLTGFYRTGCCETGPEDMGVHTVCIEATAEFLAFSKSAGNDLSTPRPEFGFAGLEPGDRWCICAARWQEAFEAGAAPR